MVLFMQGIVTPFFIVRNVVKEEIDEAVDANHISDVEVTEQSKRKKYGVHFEFSVFDQFFNSKCDKRQPHNGIDPHGIVLLYDSIAG